MHMASFRHIGNVQVKWTFVPVAGATVSRIAASWQPDFRRTGNMIHCADRLSLMAVAAVAFLAAGCYHPYPHQQPMPYSQPGYAPPQGFSPQQAPGQLIIPPSNAPLYQPEGTIQPGPINSYDGPPYNGSSTPPTFGDDSDADWNRSRDSGSGGPYYNDRNPVPLPPDERSQYDRDFPRGTSVQPAESSERREIAATRL